jgi:4-methyl-5(b-hydroxyethyl)-thiazole monophosphate biosynthesis
MTAITILVLLAPGFDTEEATVPIDYLRRADPNVRIALASTSVPNVTDSSNLTYDVPNATADFLQKQFDLLIVPGGLDGSLALGNDSAAISIIQSHWAAGRLLAASGTAVGVVLARAAGVLNGTRACGYPGTDNLIGDFGGIRDAGPVVVDRNVTSAKGAGVAQWFALAIIRQIWSGSVADSVARDVIWESADYPTPTDLPWQSETNWKGLAIVFTCLAAAFLGIMAYSIWLFVKAGAVQAP